MVLTLVYDEKGNPIGQRAVQRVPSRQQNQQQSQRQEGPPSLNYNAHGPAYQDHQLFEDLFINRARREIHLQPVREEEHSSRASRPRPQLHKRQIQSAPRSQLLPGRMLDRGVVAAKNAPVYAPSLRHTQQDKGTSTILQPEMAQPTAPPLKPQRQVVKAGADPPTVKRAVEQDATPAAPALPPKPYSTAHKQDTVNSTLAHAENLLALSQEHLQSADVPDMLQCDQQSHAQDALALVRSGHATPLAELPHGDEARETILSSKKLAEEQRKLIKERREELGSRQLAGSQCTTEEEAAFSTIETQLEECQNEPQHSVQAPLLHQITAQTVKQNLSRTSEDLLAAHSQPAVQYNQHQRYGQPAPQLSSPAIYVPPFMPYQQAQAYSPMQIPTPQPSSPAFLAHNPMLAGLNPIQQQQLLGLHQHFLQQRHQHQIQQQHAGYRSPQPYGDFPPIQYGQVAAQRAFQAHPPPYARMAMQRSLPQMGLMPSHRNSHPAAMLSYKTSAQNTPVPSGLRQSAVAAENGAMTMVNPRQQPDSGNDQHASQRGTGPDQSPCEDAVEQNQSRSFQEDVALFLMAHPGAMDGWERLCQAMRNKQLNARQFYSNGFGILYRVGATALMQRFRAFRPKEWNEQYIKLVEQHVIAQIKNEDQAQNTRKRPAEDARSDSPFDEGRTPSLIVGLSVSRAFLKKLSGIDADSGNKEDTGAHEADEDEDGEMSSSPEPASAKPKKKVPARGYRANVGDVGCASRSPARPKTKPSEIAGEGETDDGADDDSSSLSSLISHTPAASTPPKKRKKSSAPDTTKKSYKPRQRHPGMNKLTSAEVEHFGPVFDTRRAILARSDRPYIHFACGQGFAHPDDVRTHHSGKRYGRCEALTKEHEDKKWDEHESCKVSYPTISYTTLKDGFVILEEQSWDMIEGCIAAGRKVNKEMEMEGRQDGEEVGAGAEGGGKVAGPRKSGRKASAKKNAQQEEAGRNAGVDEGREGSGSEDAEHESIASDPRSGEDSTAAKGKSEAFAKKTVPKKRKAADRPSKDEVKQPTTKKQKDGRSEKRIVPSRQKVVKIGAE